MAELLLEYEAVVAAGRSYGARAWASAAHDGTTNWHAWIEFMPLNGGPAICTDRETTQPNRMCTLYWCTGLTPLYLEGALARARERAAKPAFNVRHLES